MMSIVFIKKTTTPYSFALLIIYDQPCENRHDSGI